MKAPLLKISYDKFINLVLVRMIEDRGTVIRFHFTDEHYEDVPHKPELVSTLLECSVNA
jgi:hypothetical protein